MNKKPYIIAEIGANFNGDLELAKHLIDKAKEVGCDAVKFQLWQKDELINNDLIKDLDSGKVRIENIDKWETKEFGLLNLKQQIERYVLTYDQHKELFKYAKEKQIDISSTPINKFGADFLVDIGADFMKISSMDINNLELIEYVVNKGLPTYISLGLATISEIESVIMIIPERYKENVYFLHCVSLYPPEDEIINLNFINTIRNTFNVKVGYSDHSIGYEIPLAAVALGAEVIEKHFTLDKDMPGWDHKVSANPEEMEIICKGSIRITTSLGNGVKKLSYEENLKKDKFRRSFVAFRSLPKGHEICEDDIMLKRPGTGISPDEKKYLIGRKTNNYIEMDKVINWTDLV